MQEKKKNNRMPRGDTVNKGRRGKWRRSVGRRASKKNVSKKTGKRRKEKNEEVAVETVFIIRGPVSDEIVLHFVI